MLSEIQKVKSECRFHLPEQDKKGSWKVKMTRNNVCMKMTYAINREQAEVIRGNWINGFWEFKLN